MQSIKQTNKRTNNVLPVNLTGWDKDYVPPARLLRGLSLPKARLYGMPHIGAHYTAENCQKYERDKGFSCPVCGQPATNCHHLPPKRVGGSFILETKWGKFVLLPALLALDGSGTTGCHGLFHQGKLQATWVWDDPRYERLWFEGDILSVLPAHSPALYRLGQWVITGADDVIAYRELDPMDWEELA